MTESIRTILDHTTPLEHPRGDRFPLFVWGAQHPGTDSEPEIIDILTQLDSRGIPLISAWRMAPPDASLANGIRVGRLQQDAGLTVTVNANDILHRFFNGDPDTAHIDEQGNRFFDDSFDPKLSIGCPFAIDHRIPEIRDRVTHFAAAYRDAGIQIDLTFADWEIDGPIEWNGAWEASRRCTRCCANIPDIDDFESLQTALRSIRSRLQREAYSEILLDHFPDSRVGNYAVYPHGGERYWYDYFEAFPNAGPSRRDQKARVRPWAAEFPDTGYNLAVSVIYTRYRTYDWYDFDEPDYRWFYNMLQVASNAGEHTGEVPLLSFVHWHTTAAPPNPDPEVRQMSETAYKELLWHTLLRGHNGLFLWCQKPELAKELKPLHPVYAESLKYAEILTNGIPLTFAIPQSAKAVVSAVRHRNDILVRCTPFGQQAWADLPIDEKTLRIDAGSDCKLITTETLDHTGG